VEVKCLDSDSPSVSVYTVYVLTSRFCPVNRTIGGEKKSPDPKKVRTSAGRNSPTCRSPLALLRPSLLFFHLLPLLPLPPYTAHPCHHEVSRAIDLFIPARIYAGSRLLLDNGLPRAPFSALNVGTALIPSALLVAGVYAVKPEYLAYAVALAGIISTVAFFAGGSSMLHHLPPNRNLLPTAPGSICPKV
jgi:hypothetical protein